jgi:hypothetical protein
LSDPYLDNFSKRHLKKKLDYRVKGVEKTPGPGSYLLPSDFGHLIEVKNDSYSS